MILFKENTLNNMYLTLNESVTYSGTPYFNFVFKNAYTNQEKEIVLQPVTATTRYEQYNLTLGPVDILSASTLNITTGWGEYSIYEMDEDTVSASTIYNLVETGKYRVSGATEDTIIIDNNTDTYTVYKV